ncbi:MAG: 7TM diverse intracellular signaling domain-containing protein [Flavobacteriales bacterium]
MNTSRSIFLAVSLVFIVLVGHGQSLNSEPYLVSTFKTYDSQSVPVDFSKSKVVESEAINYGFKRGPQVVGFTIQNDSPVSSSLTAYIDNPLLDGVAIFDESGIIYMNGESFPFSSRSRGLPGFSFTLDLKPSETKEYHVGVVSSEQIVIPVRIGESSSIDRQAVDQEIFYAIYFGLMIVMLLYNLFVYFSVRDVVYVYYVFYIAAVGLTQLVLGGYANKYFWPSYPMLAIVGSSVVPALSGIGTIAFARPFIRLREHAPFIDKALLFYVGLYVVSIVLACIGQHHYAQLIINFNAASAFILVVAAFKAIRGGSRPAKFFLAAFSMFLIGVTVYALRNFGVLGYNTFTSFALPVGSALETVLLSFALADRINQFKKEKEESQQQSIAVMKENQRLITEQNVRLEQMVHERTLDLEKANDDLSTTLSDLRITQKQLVESEKLASLGQMTAGIAHEINNPINFVQSNVQPLRRDIDDMLSLLDEFARLENDAAISEKVAGLHKKYHELDMPYVRDEVKQLLHGIEDGSRRTAEFVRGLGVFSRLDRDSLVSASVNDCIQSTLIVMKNITKGAVTLEIELDTAMPHIYCFPGKLNQVFMNILNNAVQATDIPGRAESDRLIKILSAHDADTIRVTITDNGTGIAEGIRSRIFDPFFTTKKVGEGTGLGLSIALGIVEEHKGHIEVHSEEGKGTTVIVSLPRLADIETT